MFRLSNVTVMGSLLCALVPVAAGCGGGDSAGAEAGSATAPEGGSGGGMSVGSSKAGSSSKPGSNKGGSAAMVEPGSAGVGSSDEDVDAGDTEAPTVVATLPLDGATGVTDDTVIEIQFSEPMDTASVEAAYDSVDLPNNRVTFGWNDEGTTLTVTPLEKLEYSLGKDPAEALAKGYVVTIGTGAMDLAQNPMAEAADMSFMTLRQILASLPTMPALSGHVNLVTKTDSVTIQAGDTVGDEGDRALLTFDLSSVPADYELLSAQVVAQQTTVTNHPFLNLSQDPAAPQLRLFNAKYDSRPEATMLLAAIIGVFSDSPAVGVRSLDVLKVAGGHLKDRDARGNLSQFAMQFFKQTDKGADTDKVQFAEAALELKYLTP